MMERAFKGFAALPPSAWRDILGVGPAARFEEVQSAYRSLARRFHTDTGNGDHNRMVEINAAWEQAQKELASGQR